MQSKQEDRMSREEIIYYVDNLIEANKKSYDKRLAPLLYEFFLRANEKFEWSKNEFLEKYQNFKNNVKTLKITDMEKVGMPSSFSSGFSFDRNNKGIYINKKDIKNVKNELTNESINADIIDALFHECLHATDLYINKDVIVKFGLYNVADNEIYKSDTILNEFANVLSASLISSEKTMYADNLGINTENIKGYETIHIPGSIICSALDMTEIEFAKLKDKGRDAFNQYLKNKFSYFRDGLIEDNLDTFAMGLNVIWNSSKSKDKENATLGLESVIDTALELIRIRLDKSIGNEDNKKEALERIYYDIYKIQKLLEKVDRYYQDYREKEIYNIERFNRTERLLNRVKLYNKLIENENLFSTDEKEKIYAYAKKCGGFFNDDIIKSKFEEKNIDSEFDIQEIAKKYYIQSNDPLNDNTELIKYVRKTFRKPINKRISEKVTELINRTKHRKLKELPLPELEEEDQTTKEKAANFKNFVKYETEIEYKMDKEKENADISRGDEESTRD